jgi:hypothetical protein
MSKLRLVGLLVCLTSATPARAQVCVGDCAGLGRVRISDLILAVNIALGRAALDSCPALGTAPIGITDLIHSVANALCDCRPCPTAPPTRTPTVTPAVTATDTATPTPTAVTSVWREDNLKLGTSNCPSDINTALRNSIASSTDTYTVRIRGTDVEVENSAGDIAAVTIDPDGTLHAEEVDQETQAGCTVTVTLEVAVNLNKSPSTATYDGKVATMTCPRSIKCSFRITSRWTRLSGALRAVRDRVGPHQSATVLLPGTAGGVLSLISP